MSNFTCTCLDDIKKKLAEHTGDPEPKGPFEGSLQFDQEANKLSYVQTLKFAARTKKKRSDELTQGRKTFPAIVRFCPFCGAPCGEEEQSETEASDD